MINPEDQFSSTEQPQDSELKSELQTLHQIGEQLLTLATDEMGFAESEAMKATREALKTCDVDQVGEKMRDYLDAAHESQFDQVAINVVTAAVYAQRASSDLVDMFEEALSDVLEQASYERPGILESLDSLYNSWFSY